MKSGCMSMIGCFILCVLAGLFIPFTRGAEEKSKPQGAIVTDPDEPIVSDMRVRTLKGHAFYYASYETTFDKLGAIATEATDALEKAAAAKKIQVTGAVVFVYHGVTDDPAKPFKLEIGAEVADGAKADGDFKVRELADFKCASLLYQGPISKIMAAFEKLIPAMGEAGMKPGDESREYYLHWEGDASPNNVMMLGVGLKEGT